MRTWSLLSVLLLNYDALRRKNMIFVLGTSVSVLSGLWHTTFDPFPRQLFVFFLSIIFCSNNPICIILNSLFSMQLQYLTGPFFTWYSRFAGNVQFCRNLYAPPDRAEALCQKMRTQWLTKVSKGIEKPNLRLLRWKTLVFDTGRAEISLVSRSRSQYVCTSKTSGSYRW